MKLSVSVQEGAQHLNGKCPQLDGLAVHCPVVRRVGDERLVEVARIVDLIVDPAAPSASVPGIPSFRLRLEALGRMSCIQVIRTRSWPYTMR